MVDHVSRPPDARVKQRAPDHRPMQVDLMSGDEKKEQQAAASSPSTPAMAAASKAQPRRPEKDYKEEHGKRAKARGSRGGAAHRGGGKGKRDDSTEGGKGCDFGNERRMSPSQDPSVDLRGMLKIGCQPLRTWSTKYPADDRHIVWGSGAFCDARGGVAGLGLEGDGG